MSPTSLMHVFDLDGVITEPNSGHVSDEVVSLLHGLLKNGEPVGINTGRSFEWIEKELIRRLHQKSETSICDRLVVVCEMAGEIVTWNSNVPTVVASNSALSREVYEKARNWFEANKTTFDTMFWDLTKRTMASIEKKPSIDIDLYDKEKQSLVQQLQKEINDPLVQVNATTIAVDIQTKSAGKYTGASYIFEWAKQHFPTISSYISIGDSHSDYEMARYFADQGKESTFVYVGFNPEAIKQHKGVRLVTTKNHFTAGVSEYFAIINT